MNERTNSFQVQKSAHIRCMLFSVMIMTPTMIYTAQAKQMDAFEQNRKLGRGINIIGYDPLWRAKEQGRFKENHFKIIKDGGFSTVRINLHPFRHMDEDQPYQLNSSWFKVLDWAVENALKNRLMVILDMHEFNAMGADPQGNKAKFLSFWRQVAEHFKDAPTRRASRRTFCLRY